MPANLKSPRSVSPTEYQVLAKLARARASHLVRRRDWSWLTSISPRPDRVIARMLEKGSLISVAPGRYLIAPVGADRIEMAAAPQAVLDARLSGTRYYIAFHSALSEHGLTDLEDARLFVVVFGRTDLPGVLDLAGQEVVVTRITVERKWFGAERATLAAGGTYWRSDIERTLLDALERPDLAGSIETVVRAWARALGEDRASIRRLADYAIRLGPTVVRRTGFWLSAMGHSKDAEPLLKHRGSSGSVPLDPSGSKSGPTDPVWRVVVNVPSESYRGWIGYGK